MVSYEADDYGFRPIVTYEYPGEKDSPMHKPKESSSKSRNSSSSGRTGDRKERSRSH